MNCRIVIGSIRFENCHKIVIDQDINDIGDTATITLPRAFKKLNEKSVLEYIKSGDPVTVEWGYNGKYTHQFSGFVRIVEAEAPLVVHCDDAWYKLKRNSWIKSYNAISLKALLQEIAPGYEIQCPENILLGKYILDGESTFEIIKKIQRELGLYARMFDKKIVLSFGYKWNATNTKIYDRQKNVRKSDLKWQRKEDINIKVVVEYEEKGVKKTVSRESIGNDMQVVKKESVNIGLGRKEAEELAEAKLNQYAFDGFTGSVTGFGIPDTNAGDALEMRDNRNPDKVGKYIIERITAEYAPAHISRQNYLGRKL